MRTSIIAILAAAAAISAATRDAHACGQGSYGPGYSAALLAGTGIMAVDAALFVVSGISTLAGHQNARGYAVFEAIWTIPQFALGAYATVSVASAYGNATPIAVYTGVMALLS